MPITHERRACVMCGADAPRRPFRHCGDPVCARFEAIGRFWDGVDMAPGQGPRGDCWEWVKARPPKEHRNRKVFAIGNYGQFTAVIDGLRFHVASRFSCHVFNGPIPEGYEVAHSCDHPCCCRPDHLSAKTQAQNMGDKRGKTTRRRAYQGWLTNPAGNQMEYSFLPSHPTPEQVAEWRRYDRFDSVRYINKAQVAGD